MDKWKELSTEALDYYQKGDYEKAEEKFVAALRDAEQFGEDDPRLSDCLDNVGWILQIRGKKAEAEPVLKRSLRIMERVKGSDHPDNSWILASLGGVYLYQGKYQEAEEYYRRAITIDEKALGPNHVNVATGLEKRAEILRKTGRESEANGLEARAREIRAKNPPKS